MKSQTFNVILLGLAFFFIFFSYQTSVFIQQTVVNSIKTKPEYDFHGEGYLSLCLTSIIFAISNWLSPSIIAFTGLKYGMFLAGITYAIYPASFINPTTTLFYVAAALVGLGAGPIWTAQGGYLTENSDDETSGRNSGIFWAMLQSSILFGNLFVYVVFNDKATISDETRHLVYGVLTTVCSAGVIILLALPAKSKTIDFDESNRMGAWGQFLNALKLMRSPDILILTIVFFFTGQLVSFIFGVYGTALGATWQFGVDAKKYIGLSGAFMGFGEILGGTIFGLMGTTITKSVGRDKIFAFGGSVTLVSMALVYVNLPPDSASTDRAELDAIIKPNIWIAMGSSVLMGLGDACFNTQVYSIIMSLYAGNSVPAFALFKFYQSMGSGVAFFYSTVLGLHDQIFLLIGFTIVSTIMFYIVESKNQVRLASPRNLSDNAIMN